MAETHEFPFVMACVEIGGIHTLQIGCIYYDFLISDIILVYFIAVGKEVKHCLELFAECLVSETRLGQHHY